MRSRFKRNWGLHLVLQQLNVSFFLWIRFGLALTYVLCLQTRLGMTIFLDIRYIHFTIYTFVMCQAFSASSQPELVAACL